MPPEKKIDAVQQIIHWSFRAFLGFLSVTKVLDVEVYYPERFFQQGPGLIVANHPTLLDVVVLISQLPQADCIVKKALFENPFLSLIVRWAGYVPNDGGEGVVCSGLDRLNLGRHLVIFPEGTRSPSGEVGPLTRGFAHMVVRSRCRVIPVRIKCDPAILNREYGPFFVPSRRPKLSVMVMPPVRAERLFDSTESVSVSVRKISKSIRGYFEEPKIDEAYNRN